MSNNSSWTAKKRGVIIEGVPPIPCIFCEYMTSIQFDLDLHLYEVHRKELIRLPIGKGNMDTRIAHAIEQGKKIRDALSNVTPKARDSLGIYSYDRINIIAPPSSSQVNEGLDFILNHLDEPLFPRTIMTKELGRQINLFDRQSILHQFKRSDYHDCRINAYSSLTQKDESLQFYVDEAGINLTIIVIDLDLKDLDNSKEKLNVSLQETLYRIREIIGGHPTVLDTGNGYHIYQPISGIIFDYIDGLREYAKFDKYYLPNKFLKFAEQYLTGGMSDPQHNSTVNSCLMRIPGTINSKGDKEVCIVQEWDYHRPSVEHLLPKYLSVRGIPNQDLDRQTVYPKYLQRNYKYLSRQIRYIWIDTLLQIPLGDYRKYVMRLIIAPYLIVVKQRPYGECVKIMIDWLNRCNCVEHLRFSAEFTVRRFLLNAQRVGYTPIRLEKLQQEIPALYDIVMRKMQSRSR
jgi:hypothetical protein